MGARGQADASAETHEAAVARISAAVRGFHARAQPFRIYHGATNSTRSPQYARGAVVDTSGLSRVLAVDAAAGVARVEPNVSMRALVAATLAHGLVPPVVMELPGITAGGGFAGNSGESSSWRHGLFDCTVAAIEVVLASGDVVRASAEENADLFAGAAGSYGTLGVITQLDVRLIKAAPFVHMTYLPVTGAADALATMQALFADGGVLYIDAIMYSASEGVVIAGRLAETAAKPVRFLRAHDPQYYLHARKMLGKSQRAKAPAAEATPLQDYLFRYDRGAFWVARHAFGYFAAPYNRVTRFVLDPVLRAAPIFHAFHEAGLAARYVVQDVTVPAAALADFMQRVDQSLGIWPLWLCPLSAAGPSARTLPRHLRECADGGEMFVNVGIWGGPVAGMDPDQCREVNRTLERDAAELQGAKALYARCYYTEDEFWAIYDREAYDALRKKWGATELPSIFDKMSAGSRQPPAKSRRGLAKMWDRRPMAGFRGVAKLVLRSDYLFAKDK